MSWTDSIGALLGDALTEHEESGAVGRRIGPYEVTRLVGVGGMGAVYEAVRADDQYRKRVAIKFLRRGLEGDLAVRRFRYERQILANLSHPNIAALLDTGDRALLGILATLLVVLGVRLASASSDRLRIELSTERWSVDALVGGRPIHRSGAGPLLPELVRDALVIWSSDGRVGVLRGELEPEERAWLSERLAVLAEDSTLSAEAKREVDDREADDQGQKQEAEGGQ